MKHRTFPRFATFIGKNLSFIISVALTGILYSPQAKPMLNQQVTNLKNSLTILKDKYVQLSTELTEVKNKLGQKAPEPGPNIDLPDVSITELFATNKNDEKPLQELTKKIIEAKKLNEAKDPAPNISKFKDQKIFLATDYQQLEALLTKAELRLLKRIEIEIKNKNAEKLSKEEEQIQADKSKNIDALETSREQLYSQWQTAVQFIKSSNAVNDTISANLAKKMKADIGIKIKKMNASLNTDLDTKEIEKRKDKNKQEIQEVLRKNHIQNQIATIEEDLKTEASDEFNKSELELLIIFTILETNSLEKEQKVALIEEIPTKQKNLLTSFLNKNITKQVCTQNLNNSYGLDQAGAGFKILAQTIKQQIIEQHKDQVQILGELTLLALLETNSLAINVKKKAIRTALSKQRNKKMSEEESTDWNNLQTNLLSFIFNIDLLHQLEINKENIKKLKDDLDLLNRYKLDEQNEKELKQTYQRMKEQETKFYELTKLPKQPESLNFAITQKLQIKLPPLKTGTLLTFNDLPAKFKKLKESIDQILREAKPISIEMVEDWISSKKIDLNTKNQIQAWLWGLLKEKGHIKDEEITNIRKQIGELQTAYNTNLNAYNDYIDGIFNNLIVSDEIKKAAPEKKALLKNNNYLNIKKTIDELLDSSKVEATEWLKDLYEFLSEQQIINPSSAQFAEQLNKLFSAIEKLKNSPIKDQFATTIFHIFLHIARSKCNEEMADDLDRYASDFKAF